MISIFVQRSLWFLLISLVEIPGGILSKSKDKARLLINNTKLYSRKLYQLYSLKSALNSTGFLKFLFPITVYTACSVKKIQTQKRKKTKIIKITHRCLLESFFPYAHLIKSVVLYIPFYNMLFPPNLMSISFLPKSLLKINFNDMDHYLIHLYY